MAKHSQKSGLILLMTVLLTFSGQGFSQVRVYVNTDLEGISGVYKFSQTREKDTPLNLQACEYFMDDIAAVIRGLRDGGADDIVVLDGHGSQVVIPHLMEPGATYITGRPRPGAGNLSLLDSTFSAMVMIGFHAMMGTPDGVLNHTQSSLTENRYWYNGVESGELAQNAIIAGYYGIPVIMVSGDVATCREAVKFFGEKIVTVPVKKGLSREAAMLYPFDETRQALYDGAIKAMSVISSCKPYKIEFPAKVRMQYLNRDNGKPEPEIITVEGIARDALHILDFERQ
jgi:D-amino peptidase